MKLRLNYTTTPGVPGVWIAIVTPLWLYRRSKKVQRLSQKPAQSMRTEIQSSTQPHDNYVTPLKHPKPSTPYIEYFKSPALNNPVISVAIGVFAVAVWAAVVAQLVLKVVNMT